MVFDYGTNLGVKFKATCLAVLEDVRRTGAPVLITRFGQPVAEVVPPRPQKRRRLGSMSGSFEVIGDIVGPIGAFEGLNKRRR